MILGIIAGVVTALLQSFSYIFSAGFMMKYKSSLRLVIFSQLVMGVFCLPIAPLLFPVELWKMLPEFLLGILMWVLFFVTGQTAFFNTLRSIEASRVSSLLGLKIIVLSVIYVLWKGHGLGSWQWLAVFLSAIAAMAMNWSGGSRFTLRGMLWLALTLVAYSLTDMAETYLVRMPASGNVIMDACGVAAVCYLLLGILTLPMLFKYRWSRKQFVMAMPFGLAWFLSQVSLFICFGLLGTVFGNVIQSSRGLFSIGLGIILLHYGYGKLDAKIGGKMWLRRGIAAALMTIAIIIYSLAQSKI